MTDLAAPTAATAVDAGMVLIVEDDADLGGFLEAALRRRVGRRVLLAQNAEQAIGLMADRDIDVLVTDIQMPGMSGLELVQQVRRTHPALPIVMMTAHASVDYAVGALRHQVDEFLIKPVSAAELVPKVRDLAERGAATRLAARALAAVDPEVTAPAEASRAERKMLQGLASLTSEQESLSQQLRRAAQVQQNLLPQAAPSLPGFEFAAACLPSYAIGGDFYDWYAVPGAVDFTVADVMGKGIPAALVTATVRATMRAGAHSGGPAAGMRSAAVQLAADLGETGTFVTVFHGRVEQHSGLLRYCDAGHGLTMHVRPDGTFAQLLGDGLPLGVSDPGGGPTPGDAPAWQESSVVMGPGDRLVCFSDGLMDLLGGTEAALLDVAAMAAAADDCAGFVDAVSALAAQVALPDDVTVVAIGRTRERVSR